MSTAQNSSYTLSMECILKEAKYRWLKGYEVLCILQNYQLYGLQLSATPPHNPTSDLHYPINTRKDGVNWKKQKDGKTVRESHEKLKVGGVKVLSCCYTRSADNPSFHRRIYWLLDGDSNTVLVHYLDGSLTDKSDNPLQTPLNTDERMMLSTISPSIQDMENNNNEKGDSVSSEEEEMNLNEIAPSPSSRLMDESLMDFVNSFSQDELMKFQLFRSPPPQRAQNSYASTQPSSSGRLAKIFDFAPEWDYTDGGAKILITGPELRGSGPFYVLFDQVEVPGEIIFDGVLRCRVPPHFAPGYVSLCVTRGNFSLFSEVKHFEYRKPQGKELESSIGMPR